MISELQPCMVEVYDTVTEGFYIHITRISMYDCIIFVIKTLNSYSSYMYVCDI